MNTIPHLSPHKANVIAEGLSPEEPRMAQPHLHRFRVKFRVTKRMARWDQKALAMRYLYNEYEANTLEFFRSMDNPDNCFVCEFTSFAL